MQCGRVGAGKQTGKQAGELEGIQAGMQVCREDRRPGSRETGDAGITSELASKC